MKVIYKLTNLVNGKYYHGRSIDYDERKYNHFATLRGGYHINPHLQYAWNKYGEDNFKFTVMETCNDLTHEEFVAREQWYLSNTKCTDPNFGYNIRKTADCTGPMAEETKLKIKNTLLGHEVSIATRNKIRSRLSGRKLPQYCIDKMIGRKLSEETKRKLSIALTGQKRTPEQCARMGASKIGQKRTSEQCARIGAAKLGFIPSFESNEKRRIAMTGKIMPRYGVEKSRITRTGQKRTAEQCERIGASKRGIKSTPEAIAARHHFHNEETKQRISAKLKGRTFSVEHKEKIKQAWALRKQRDNVNTNYQIPKSIIRPRMCNPHAKAVQ